MKNIVKVDNGKEFVAVVDIIQFSQNSKRSVFDLIRDNESDLRDFGDLSLNKEYGLDLQLLNEPQTYFLLSLMSNTENIKKFKKELIKQFFKMRNIIESKFELQLQKKDIYIAKLSKERDYAKTRKGNAQSIVNIIREYNIEISSGEFNELLFKFGMVNRVPKDGYDYVSPTMSNGTPLVNVDMALALIDTNGFTRGKGFVDNNPTLFEVDYE